MIQWAGIHVWASPALVSEVGSWEAISLTWEDIHKSNWDDIDSRLGAEMRKTLLICALTLFRVSCESTYLEREQTQYNATFDLEVLSYIAEQKLAKNKSATTGANERKNDMIRNLQICLQQRERVSVLLD